MKHTQVKILADSLSPQGHRLVSFELHFPRIVEAELLRHRVFSLNSGSSRAQPSSKMLERVSKNRFIPTKFSKNCKGMSNKEWLSDEDNYLATIEVANYFEETLELVESLNDLGVHKQHANRYLQPFEYQTLVLTATEFDNFFKQRISDNAQPEIRELAIAMRDAMSNSVPRQLQAGDYHLPFGDKLDNNRLQEAADKHNLTLIQAKLQVVCARIARVSYLNHEGADDYDDDIRLYRFLVDNLHLSPTESVARCMSDEEYTRFSHTTPHGATYGHCNNIRGFVQHRWDIENNIN